MKDWRGTDSTFWTDHETIYLSWAGGTGRLDKRQKKWGVLQVVGRRRPVQAMGHRSGWSLRLWWKPDWACAQHCFYLFSSASFSHFHSTYSKLSMNSSALYPPLIGFPNLWSGRENGLPSNNPSPSHYQNLYSKHMCIVSLASCPRMRNPLNFVSIPS